MFDCTREYSVRSRAYLWGRVLLPIFVVGCVTWLSLAPSDGLPKGEIFHLLRWFQHYTGIAVDKVVHAGMYFCVCGAMLIALPKRVFRLRGCLIAFLFAVIWGVLMEFAQASATALGWTTRAFDFHDMLANGIGAMLALAIFCLIRKLFSVMK